MKIISSLNGGSRLRKAVMGVALGIVLITAAAPLHAADRRDAGRRGGAGDRDWRAHESRHVRGYEPGVVYAPPVVYQPPQYEAPGLNLIIPLNFR